MEQSYKEKYEDILARLERAKNDDEVCDERFCCVIDDLIPELAESEDKDEKIRKRLITDFGTIGKKEWGGLEVRDILAWLERQGEQKTITFNNAHIIDPALNDYCCKQYDALHKENGGVLSFARLQHLAMDIYGWCCKEYLQGEQKPNPCDGCVNRKGCVNCENGELREIKQKPADKVEPKFHEGEWITNGDYTWIIVGVKPLDYVIQSKDGNIVDDTISHIDEQFHSFTIADAKNGDVLYINNTVSESIIIYKSFNNGLIKKYASYNKFGFEGEHYLTLNDGYITPATKEQRDILMKAMTDAGYTFDFERKELKKIKQKPAEWSEEDNWYVEDIISLLDLGGSIHTKEQVQDWLKSLKGRVQPQNHWKPSDEQMLAIKTSINTIGKGTITGKCLEEVLEQLKKLKG